MSGLYGGNEFEEWVKREILKSDYFDIQRKLINIPDDTEVNLNQEDLFSLLHIAVDNNDREYFEELVERLNKL